VTVADSDDNKITIIEVVHPRERYLRTIVSRATANSTVDGILAVLSHPSKMPTTQDSTVQESESHASPAEGTA